MNVQLFDGTVRCAEHFDAASYDCETIDPCTYCGSSPEVISVPVVMSDPDSGETIPAFQVGPSVENVLWNLHREVTDPSGLWFGWEFVALV